MSPTPETIAKMRAGLAAARAAGTLKPRPALPSWRKAIDAMCRDCIYDPCGQGTWRAQTEACTSPECPLYELRPRAATRGAASGASFTESDKENLDLDGPGDGEVPGSEAANV